MFDYAIKCGFGSGSRAWRWTQPGLLTQSRLVLEETRGFARDVMPDLVLTVRVVVAPKVVISAGDWKRRVFALREQCAMGKLGLLVWDGFGQRCRG